MRRDQLDSTSQNVYNLAQNPRWETGTGLNQIVRQNLCGNPRGINAYSPYSTGGAQVITPNVDITSTPIPDVPLLTRANRVTYSGTPSNPGVQFFNGTPGTQYTFSAYIYIESMAPTPGTLGLAESGITSGTNATNTVGVWQRISWTRTVTSGNGIGVRVAAPSGGSGSFLITGIQIETSPVVTSYYDGSFPPVGDYSYNWAGTVNNSISREVAPAADMANSSGGAYRASYLSTDRPAGNSKFLRLITYSPGVSVALNPTDVIIRDGVPRTDLVWLRANRDMTITMRYRNPTGSNVVSAPAATLVANRWQLYRNFATPTGADDMALGVLSSTPQSGDIIDMGPHMTVEGNYTGDIVEGTKPFSKWLGTADRSASVGYPPQFLDIAGKPVIDIEGVGSRTNSGVPDPFMGRTFYCVHEANANTGNYNVCASYGVVGSKGFMVQTAASGSFSMANRYDAPGGTFNGGIVLPARSFRRHVQAFAFTEGLTSVSGCANGGADVTNVVSPGTGWDDSRAICTANSELRNVRFIVFNEWHSRAKRIEMSRYLGNKYGAYVA